MPARDYIEGLVCGFPREIRDRTSLVVLEAYADDSADERIYVLAGWVGNACQWGAFSDDYEKAALPRSFHMKKVRRPNGKRVRDLATITMSQAMYRVDCVLHQGNYKKIVKGKIKRELDSPYFVLFYQVILATARLLDRVGSDDTADWIFDEQGKIGDEAVAWYRFIKEHARPNLKRRLGSTPIFRDDEKVLPLKAADLFAWQIRKHLSEEQPKGVAHNEILDLFLAKYGVSSQMTGPHLEEFIRSVNSGLLSLKANCKFFLPPKC